MPAPSFIETLNNLNIPYQVELSKDGYKAKVTIDDECLTAHEAHSLHQLITDPNSPKTAIIALKILAKEKGMDIKSIASHCVFVGDDIETTKITTYPPNIRTY